MERLPKTASEWTSLMWLWVGGLFGWLGNPAIWIAFGPRKWLAILATFAYGESRYSRYAFNADENAMGMLQYLPDTWAALGGTNPEVGEAESATLTIKANGYWFSDTDAWSPRMQGYNAAKYFNDRIMADWGIIPGLFVPYWGVAAARWQWRHAPGTYTGLMDAWAEFKTEQDGVTLSAWVSWFWISLAVFVAPVLICWTWMKGKAEGMWG